MPGGRISHWVRNMSIWRHYANYFPVKLVKTEDLDPERNYMFVCHPHGVMVGSHVANFGTEGTGFSQLFPGLTPHILTLEDLFRHPFKRELLLAMGYGAATTTSMKWYLTHPGRGHVLALIVGGVLESFDTIPNTMRLTLNNRFGFVKLALEHGDWSTSEDSIIRKFQLWMNRVVGYTIPHFYGRGLFGFPGILPYRVPITTVVGKPMDVPLIPEPSREQIAEYHRKYIQCLREFILRILQGSL
ncbi:unnamed protein product [Oppiella nova]|uniref:diacylglycerol O-acyltransferase n=1 Tax=Oppiella nova TaxID=334625 RepID=A0A7R9M7Q4_9ACAR|nr:unnamed protein product [Oppiella nova]CAG2172363.1 unnamed protein product [Oppiella nova]